MTIITFFNSHPPHTVIRPDAFKDAIGKTVKLTRDGVQIGTGTMLLVDPVEGGFIFTYETDADFGVRVEYGEFSADTIEQVQEDQPDVSLIRNAFQMEVIPNDES